MTYYFNDQQLSKIQAVEDEILDSLSKTHKLIFPPIMETCAYCLKPAIDTYMGNAGLHGGPLPNTCGYCGGTGKRAKEVSENIQLEIDYSPREIPKNVTVEAPGVMLPWDVILVKGYLKDLPRLQQCQEIQINLPSAPVTMGKYRLSGDGTDSFNITKNRYFVAALVRLS